MRKRRLYRYAAAQAGSPSWPQVATRAVMDRGGRLATDDELSRRAYEIGLRNGLDIALSQQDRLIDEARNAAIMSAQNEPSILSARRRGYEQGFAAGIQAGRGMNANANANAGGQQFTYADLEQARRRGVEEGRMAASAQHDTSALQQKIIDKVMDECRVISESNPNMAPGVNALKHRIKKIV